MSADTSEVTIMQIMALNKLTERNIKDKFENLKAMNTLIMSLNDEGAWLSWIMYVPDQGSDQDFQNIAEGADEDFQEIVMVFRTLLQDYGKYGFYIGGKNWGQGKIGK